MNREDAIKFGATGWWKELPADAVVAFQLFEDLLCMDFPDYHKAVEEALGRPVWTHEFAKPEILRDEFLKMRPKATLEEIMGQLPPDKTIFLVMPDENREG